MQTKFYIAYMSCWRLLSNRNIKPLVFKPVQTMKKFTNMHYFWIPRFLLDIYIKTERKFSHCSEGEILNFFFTFLLKTQKPKCFSLLSFSKHIYSFLFFIDIPLKCIVFNLISWFIWRTFNNTLFECSYIFSR